MKTICRNGNIVESWFDRKTRNFIVQSKDSDGNHIGDADFTGTKAGQKISRADAIKKNGGKLPKLFTMRVRQPNGSWTRGDVPVTHIEAKRTEAFNRIIGGITSHMDDPTPQEIKNWIEDNS